MVNSEKFAARLENIFDFYELNASSFADKIDVGRSSISHIISGRNKPSLDFIMKVVETFPEVDLYWLLNGKGNFPKSAPSHSASGLQNSSPTPAAVSGETSQKENSSATQHIASDNNPVSGTLAFPQKGKPIKKIVIFYRDGSFEAFEN